MRYAYLFVCLILFLSGCQQQADGQGSVDWLTRTIAIVGAIIAVCGLALGIKNYRWDRAKWEILRKDKEEEAKAKAEQSQERVTAELTIMGILDDKKEPRYVWSVRIYNPTSLVIPLKRVALVFMDNIRPIEERKKRNLDTTSEDLVPRKTNHEALARHGRGDFVNQPQPLPELEPRKEVVCTTLGFAKFLVEDIASQAPKDVDITIYSHTGAIHCIKGDVIIAECKRALAAPIHG